MRKKDGFVLIETIITIVVLAAALLIIYSEFNGLLIKEKSRLYYDDIAYIYRTYHVKNFFAKYNLASVLNGLNNNNPILITGCGDESLGADATLCDNLINSLNIMSIAVSKANLSYIRDLDVNNCSSNKCYYLRNFSAEEISYLYTLGDLSSEAKYIMIIEYVEQVSDNKIERNYAWIKI